MEDPHLYHPTICITFFNREDDVAAGRKCSKHRSQVASAICVAVWNSTFLASSVWRRLNQVWLDASCMLGTQGLMFLHTSSSVPFFNFSNTVDDRRLRTQNCISWDEGSCFAGRIPLDHQKLSGHCQDRNSSSPQSFRDAGESNFWQMEKKQLFSKNLGFCQWLRVTSVKKYDSCQSLYVCL